MSGSQIASTDLQLYNLMDSTHTTTFSTLSFLIARYVPSQGDVAVFEALSGAPDAKFVNALRWYNQINSYTSNERLV